MEERGTKREQDQENWENLGVLRTVASIHANAKKAIIKKKTETKKKSKKKKAYTLRARNGQKEKAYG